jgi:hypothetical protein
MLRRNQLMTAAALALACSLPASAAALAQNQDLRSPDTRQAAAASEGQDSAPPSSIATPDGQGNQDLRMPDTPEAAGAASPTARAIEPTQDLRTPDATDAARDLPRVHVPAPVVEIREVPSSGFDWGDAGIGAAGMLALFSIAAGSTLLVTNRRRRRGFQVAAR